MASTELYGVDGRLVESIGSTPVSTNTNLYFIGASASGELHKAHLITSMTDYKAKLGGEPGDGYNLTEAAIAAFSIAGINKIWMIPVSHSTTFNAVEYIGDAELFTGVYAIEKQLMDNPTAVNILCAPSIDDSSVIAALNTVSKKAANHWISYMIYDLPEAQDQINARLVAQVDEIVEDKQLAEEHASAVWGHIKTSGGYIVSGAAVRACLMALADTENNVPERVGGNLPVPAVQGVCFASKELGTIDTDSIASVGKTTPVKIEVSGATQAYDSKKSYSCDEDVQVVNDGGYIAVVYTGTGDTGVFADGITITESTSDKLITIPESYGNSLSADGVNSWNNQSGTLYTWGDHTSLYANDTVADERARFENNIRMLIMIINRFQLKYRFSIDNPMSLQMRNDVTNEQLDYCNQLVAIGALVGQPTVEFTAIDNPVDEIAQGHFTWSIAATPTLPFKYGNVKVAYSQAGLSVYTQE